MGRSCEKCSIGSFESIHGLLFHENLFLRGSSKIVSATGLTLDSPTAVAANLTWFDISLRTNFVMPFLLLPTPGTPLAQVPPQNVTIGLDACYRRVGLGKPFSMKNLNVVVNTCCLLWPLPSDNLH